MTVKPSAATVGTIDLGTKSEPTSECGLANRDNHSEPATPCVIQDFVRLVESGPIMYRCT